ncbi:MAG: phage antirepressor KilAC domain-containing protein [Desulfovibrio sp.]|uniref:phage antirepressor KilAC domain-containing protein n=1 Tax=Desulfovibrio sp. TaxID=885 RepID=UPI002584EF63|nr:phage antirepressor KilAC domain-containing protein [Desulfovibrio sp.]MCD7985238.1 phage antirepressor KilAC domain-containing protein [Desulfovibrio sp.]
MNSTNSNRGSDTLKIFQNRNFGKVRVVEGADGEPWFVAKDVAEALGYTWQGVKIIKHVPEEWRLVYSMYTSFGTKPTWALSEQGLYFFLARSDKPAALPFQKWIAGEILPSIRKTGRYQAPVPVALPPVALDAILDRLISIEHQIAPLKDKAARYDLFLSTDGTCNLTHAAKIFNMTAIGLGRLLRSDSMRWLFKRGERNADANMPTKEAIDQGYMVARPVRSSQTGVLYVQPRFTAAGLDALRQKLADLRASLPALPQAETERPPQQHMRDAVLDCEPVSARRCQ